MIKELVEKIIIERSKVIEDVIWLEIQEIVKENEVETKIVINEKAVVNALKKQIPKKPIKKNPICYSKSIDGEEMYAYDYHCPLCDAMVNNEKHHCPCGQALDWSDCQ